MPLPHRFRRELSRTSALHLGIEMIAHETLIVRQVATLAREDGAFLIPDAAPSFTGRHMGRLGDGVRIRGMVG
jgi:hypothetical protein